MKKSVFVLSGLIALSTACKKDDENGNGQDLKAPVISAAEGRDAIRPQEGEVRAATTDHMHVRFSVTDESGIEQVVMDIHNTFDGHTHGRGTSTDFEPLSYRKIYEVGGEKSLNVDGTLEDVYWAGNSSVIDDNVLAGPYDFIIEAADIHGNQTSFGDNTSYVATFFIERPYAAQISITNLHDGELDGDRGANLDVQGSVEKASHSLSTDLKFLWVRLYEEDDHDHGHGHGHGDDVYEKYWGSSSWRTGMSGDALPDMQNIDLSQVLSGNNAIELPNAHGHYELFIWAEDQAGNVTQKVVHVHVD